MQAKQLARRNVPDAVGQVDHRFYFFDSTVDGFRYVFGGLHLGVALSIVIPSVSISPLACRSGQSHLQTTIVKSFPKCFGVKSISSENGS
jgi:hypothetical protein